MRPARRRALILVAAILLLTGGLVALGRQRDPFPSRSPSQRPALLVLTTLPILLGEQFSLRQPPLPVRDALGRRYRIVPIGVAAPAELGKGRLLLMAHPLAQPAEDLVALDKWVRDGGRVLLLADPMLEWPSDRPLGDPLRPPPMFTDTGLLAHWGLRLDGPDRRGPAERSLGGFAVTTASPGQLYGECGISADRLVADCRLGKGRAIVVADADFLRTRNGDEASAGLNGLLAELALLERK